MAMDVRSLQAAAKQRDAADRAERFQYANLDLQVINVLGSCKEKNLDIPHLDECLRQAGANLLGWLNRSSD